MRLLRICLRQLIPALAICLCSLAQLQAADEPRQGLKEGERLAIIGDSITEQKRYSVYIEAYLLACHPELKAEVCQFGWSGEKAGGFAGRMDNDLGWFKPTAATLCYGMNDGSYTKITPDIEKNYETPMRTILSKLKAQNALAIVGGPGAVDTKYFNRPAASAQVYNENLDKLSEISGILAGEYGFGGSFAKLHDIMTDVMAKAKAANGDAYDVCGRDGVHPGPNGHLVMAFAFLKAMKLSGDIALINVSMAEGKAEASEGHKALSFSNGVLELESSRYPFCFAKEGKETADTASILPFMPFNQDLNRFVLKVQGLPWEKAKISWGSASKELSKAQLEKGVNLAEEFIDANPFKAQFAKLMAAVYAKQAFETALIKSCITNFPKMEACLGDDKEAKDAVARIKESLIKRRAALRDEALKALVPVKHAIKIEKAD